MNKAAARESRRRSDRCRDDQVCGALAPDELIAIDRTHFVPEASASRFGGLS
jgi:hypothetical protein